MLNFELERVLKKILYLALSLKLSIYNDIMII